MANRQSDRTQTQQGGEREDRRPDNVPEQNPRGAGDDEVRGIADEEGEEFEETEELDEEDEEEGI